MSEKPSPRRLALVLLRAIVSSSGPARGPGVWLFRSRRARGASPRAEPATQEGNSRWAHWRTKPTPLVLFAREHLDRRPLTPRGRVGRDREPRPADPRDRRRRHHLEPRARRHPHLHTAMRPRPDQHDAVEPPVGQPQRLGQLDEQPVVDEHHAAVRKPQPPATPMPCHVPKALPKSSFRPLAIPYCNSSARPRHRASRIPATGRRRRRAPPWLMPGRQPQPLPATPITRPRAGGTPRAARLPILPYGPTPVAARPASQRAIPAVPPVHDRNTCPHRRPQARHKHRVANGLRHSARAAAPGRHTLWRPRPPPRAHPHPEPRHRNVCTAPRKDLTTCALPQAEKTPGVFSLPLDIRPACRYDGGGTNGNRRRP